MDKSVRRALETHVADNPVFVFFHEDGQVEVISSYPYHGAEEDTFDKAVQLWLICIDEWAKDFESGEISAGELCRYQMPVSTRTHYYIRWFLSHVFRKLRSEPSQQTARWSWRESTAL